MSCVASPRLGLLGWVGEEPPLQEQPRRSPSSARDALGRGCAPAAALVRVGVLGSPGSGPEAALPRGSREELGLGSVRDWP